MSDIKEIKAKILPFFSDDEMEGYLISPYLKELVELIRDKEPSNETLEDYILIAEAYKKMGRFSLAALYHEKALDIMVLLKISKDLQQLLYDILRERNYYVDDDVEDIYLKVKSSGLLAEELLEKTYQDVLKHRRSLKHDPVEMSEEYLAVIDEVEEKVAKNRTIYGMGACHEIWSLKWQYLLEKGINWKTPSMLNPRVMFD